ncbi:hypothetical protein BG011_003567, partial [Mortierella polycephala]
ENAAAKLKAKTDGVKVNLKRQPAQPREARFISIKNNIPVTLNPIPYDTGVSKLTAADYMGSFNFDQISDRYNPGEIPYIVMRACSALMGALCAPMVYVTLKTTRPFATAWWGWLMMTGVAVAGAMATKLNGILTMLTIGMLVSWNICDLAINSSISRSHQPAYLQSAQAEYDLNMLSHSFRHGLVSSYIEDQQADPVWSDIVFGSVVQLQSETRSTVYMHSFRKMWEDTSIDKEVIIPDRVQKQRHRQQVAGYEYSDLNTHWIVIRAIVSRQSISGVSKRNANTDTNPDKDKHMSDDDEMDNGGEIPHITAIPEARRYDPVAPRSYASVVGRATDERHSEVSASGQATTFDNADNGNRGDDDDRSWWVTEVVEDTGPAWLRTLQSPFKGSGQDTYDTMHIAPVKALETAFRLRLIAKGVTYMQQGTLMSSGTDGGEGRRELSCLKVQQQEGQDRNVVLSESIIWRMTLNDHDYLPTDTESWHDDCR